MHNVKKTQYGEYYIDEISDNGMNEEDQVNILNSIFSKVKGI